MKNLVNNLFLILILIGFIISVYLTYIHYSYNSYFCGVENNCNKVLTSRYSKVFNLPLSFWGAIYFLIITFLFIKRFFNTLFKFLIFLGIFISLTSIYLQFVVIKSICIYCLVIDFILLALPFFLISKCFYQR
ncbi:MAG: hypothetical protein NC935_08110 [Candidatus Omnitrophica bacterium]|nr:hypothetical protein [Candidatus Omnitrophota bacterium]